jgi:hypothetical protein
MHEIICTHCGKAFKIDEAGYADILKQVRDGAFEQQLHERLELAEQDKRNAVELAQAQVASAMQNTAVAKDSEIQALKARLDAGEVVRKLAVTEALSAVHKERDALANKLAQAKRDRQPAAELAKAKLMSGLENAAATKNAEIQGCHKLTPRSFTTRSAPLFLNMFMKPIQRGMSVFSRQCRTSVLAPPTYPPSKNFAPLLV